MGKVTKYGRDFNFDDDVSEDTQNQRIQSWMQMHAPTELKSGAEAAGTQTTSTPDAPSTGLFNKERIDRMGRKTGDYLRTVAQGALPFADEGIAKIRSMMPGGPDYDTALDDERMRLKRYGDEHGEVAKTLTELGGGLATIPLTMGAGTMLQGTRGAVMAGNLASKLPGSTAIAQLAAKYPRIAGALGASATGAGLGGVAGFGAGEGGFENRLSNAGYMAGVGSVLGPATRGALAIPEYITNKLYTDNRVANFLRKQLPRERSDAYDNMPNMPRTATGAVDVSDPKFANMSADELKQALQLQRTRSMDIAGQGNVGGKDVLAADAMPGTLETVLQQPGEETSKLTKQVVKRQFDPTLPLDQQAPASQYGQVGKWFDRVFGSKTFRDTEEQALATRKAAADAGFAPAFQRNIRGPEIEDALNDPYVGKAWAAAKEKMESERKPIGAINPVTGNITSYNTEFLHKLKTTMDDMANAARTKGEGTTGPDTARIIGNAKNRLNDVIMDQNDEYRQAMKQFGEHSQLIEGLRKGREDVFGKNVNELDKGIGRQDIDAYLNDPNIPDAAKDLFRIGGARALQSKLLGSDATKFTGNWADVLSNPNMLEKYQALLPPGKQSEWVHMVEQIRQLSDRRKAMEGALGNSKTASRQQRVAELNDPNVLGELVATGVNPHAPSTWRNWWNMLSNPNAAGRTTANETARILGGAGQAGNNASVEKIRDLLSRYQNREAGWDTRKTIGQRYMPYMGMFGNRQYNPQPSSQNSTQ
jgi:hypothetical protein